MKRHFTSCVLVSLCIAGVWDIYGQAPELDFDPIVTSGITDPVDIASRRDGSGRLFVVEKGGTVRIVQNETLLSQVFLTVSPIYTVGECGLLGLAFHPDTSVNYVYVYYTLGSPRRSLVARFTINPNDPNDADEDSEYNIITVDQLAFDNHKAGDIAFGPDGYLYITLGDGGSFGDPGENGQDGQELLGKILRIDVDNTEGSLHYAIPDDNPFVGDPNVRDEIWDMGMRNPWRISFDRETGDLWIGDVGQGIWEEIDFEPAGTGGFNYGWDCYEGNATYETTGCLGMNNYDFPIFVYPHSCSQGPCPYGTGNSITGGFVYRGQEYPDLQGYYICADYGSENIWLILNPEGDTSITMQDGGSMFDQLTSFGEDDNGELYAVSLLQDDLYRVRQEGILPVYLTHFEAISSEKAVELRWRVENVADIALFTLERSVNKTFFSPITTVTPDAQQSNYNFTDLEPLQGVSYYRLIYTLRDGGAQISGLRAVDRTTFDFQSNVLTRADGGLTVQLIGDIPSAKITIYAPDGRLLQAIATEEASTEISGTSTFQTGVYVIVVETDAKTWVHKWFKS